MNSIFKYQIFVAFYFSSFLGPLFKNETGRVRGKLSLFSSHIVAGHVDAVGWSAMVFIEHFPSRWSSESSSEARKPQIQQGKLTLDERAMRIQTQFTSLLPWS